MRLLGALSLCALFTGCANWSTVYREVGGSPSAGKTFVVDATQRAVVSAQRTETREEPNRKTTTTGTAVCPEPFPDALAAFFASGAATAALTGADGNAKQLQAAFATGSAVASFGLRTNSTVLLTNSLSSNCFAFLNGATNNPGYMELQRRSQTFNLGILAIEQLTGVVKGDQANAAGKSDSRTGTSDTGSLRAAADAAKKELDAAIKKRDEAETALNDKAAQVNDQAAIVKATKDKLDGTAAGDAAAKKAAQDEFDKQDAALKQLTAQHEQLGKDLQTALAGVTDARRRELDARVALDRATGNVAAASSGTATSNTTTPLAATASVAEAVTKVVSMVLLEAGRGEGCNQIIVDFMAHSDRYKDGAGKALLEQCVSDRRLTSDMVQRAMLSVR